MRYDYTLQARVSNNLIEKLKEIAIANDRSLSYIIRVALAEYASRSNNSDDINEKVNTDDS